MSRGRSEVRLSPAELELAARRSAGEQLPLGILDAPRAWRSSAITSLHVRSHMRADEVQAGEEKAQRQEDAILQHFRLQDAAVPGVRFTPSEVWRAFEELWPLTSVRRALTNLSSERCYNPPLLVHHPGDRRPGPYSRMESTWGLA